MQPRAICLALLDTQLPFLGQQKQDTYMAKTVGLVI